MIRDFLGRIRRPEPTHAVYVRRSDGVAVEACKGGRTGEPLMYLGGPPTCAGCAVALRELDEANAKRTAG